MLMRLIKGLEYVTGYSSISFVNLVILRATMHNSTPVASEEYFLNLIQPNCETSLLECLFPLLPPITLIALPPTPRLTSLLPLLPLRDDFPVFLEHSINGNPQLFDLVYELEFWFDLVGDGSEDWIRWRMLEEGEEGGVQNRLDE